MSDPDTIPPCPKRIPEKLKTIRESLGLTPDEIAPKVGAKTGAEILAYENGEDDLPVSVLWGYAKLADYPIDHLINDNLEVSSRSPMSIDDVVKRSDPDSSIIQNRLTVAGFAIAALIFSGTFTLGLHTAFRLLNEEDPEIDFRIAFLHIEMTLAVGLTLSMLTLTCLLLSQHLKDSANRWYSSRQWWFSMGQVLLFLALAQALSSTLTEVVYGIGLASQRLGFWMGLFALPVWWMLLFVAPISFIRRVRKSLSRGSCLLQLIYILAIALVLVFNAEAYRHKKRQDFSTRTLLANIWEQIIQPAKWYEPWR